MSRHNPVGNRGRENRKRAPRDQETMITILATAERMYYDAGGGNIDFSIEAARRAVAYCEQSLNKHYDGRGSHPVDQLARAQMRLESAIKQREKKFAICRATVEEVTEAEMLKQQAAEEAAQPAPEADPPPDPPAKAAQPEPAPAAPVKVHEAMNKVRQIMHGTPEAVHDSAST